MYIQLGFIFLVYHVHVPCTMYGDLFTLAAVAGNLESSEDLPTISLLTPYSANCSISTTYRLYYCLQLVCFFF